MSLLLKEIIQEAQEYVLALSSLLFKRTWNVAPWSHSVCKGILPLSLGKEAPDQCRFQISPFLVSSFPPTLLPLQNTTCRSRAFFPALGREVHGHCHPPRVETGTSPTSPHPAQLWSKELYFQTYSQTYWYYKSSVLHMPVMGEGLRLREWDKRKLG